MKDTFINFAYGAQQMLPALIGLALFLFLMLILGVLFAVTVVGIVVNGIVLYLLGVRILAEVNKGWLKEYGWGAIIAFAAIALLGNVFGILWVVTTYVIFWFIAAQLVRAFVEK